MSATRIAAIFRVPAMVGPQALCRVARKIGQSRRLFREPGPLLNDRFLRTAVIADRNRGRRGWGKPTTPEPRGEERSLCRPAGRGNDKAGYSAPRLADR